ncbi:hypothetical protein S40293_10281 [Stachybotrys chartarum IBT 40293]|nr:hypothetical protein S40293_10281 [Stachybotrys chartarum IBT 40293]
MEIPSQLCDTCQHVKLQDYLSDSTYPGTVELGSFQEIVKKDHCPLCRLIIQVLSAHSAEHWQAGIYPVEVCYLGRQNEQSDTPELEVWFNSTSETLPEGMWGHSTTLARILPLGRARIVGDKVDITRIQGWMKSCASLHGLECNPPVLYNREKPSSDLLLIDVEKMRLVACDWGSRYLALSYVWGSPNGLKTIKANIRDLHDDGALRKLKDKIPEAIRDAIDLTRAIGETYLWVDALCIVQDDPHSKSLYIPRMNHIYGNAQMTLVALNAKSASSPLPGVSRSRVPVQVHMEINDLHLISELPQLFEVAQQAKWTSRAWTFQEAILSKCCLYFTEQQVFWQCRKAYLSEDCDHYYNAPNAVSGKMANAYMRDTGNDPRMQFFVLESLVKQYSQRDLTYAADSLLAFTGILSALTDRFGWGFASALPEPLFDLALLWRPMYGINRRPRSPYHGEKVEPSLCTSPTWCWTAWHGDLFWDPWRLDSFVGHDVTVMTEVASFWMNDTGELRRVRRGQELDCNIEAPIRGATKQAPVTSVLIFEAKSINAEAYDISQPRMDECALWENEMDGGGLSNYFRNQVSHSLWIFDAAGHHCGTFPSYRPNEFPLYDDNGGSHHEMILLSRSVQDEVSDLDVRDFQNHLPMEYPSAREYYEEIFDSRYYILPPVDEIDSRSRADTEARMMRCFGHILNLVAQSFLYGEDAASFELQSEAYGLLQQVEEDLEHWRAKGPVGKLHNIVKFIRASPQRTKALPFSSQVTG